MLWAVTLTAHAQTVPAPEGRDILSTSPDKAVILAKDAAGQVFLYHVGSQTRVDFSGEVVSYLASIGRVPKYEQSRYRNPSIKWYGNEVFLVIQGVGHAVTRFNRDTGQQIGFYPSGVQEITAQFQLSADGRQLSVYDIASKRGIWHNLATGSAYPYQSEASGSYGISQQIMSPEGRFLGILTTTRAYPAAFEIWDIQHLSEDGKPTHTMNVRTRWFQGPFEFINAVEFHGYNADIIINLETRTVSRPDVALPSVAVSVTGESGYTTYSPECDRRYALRALPNRLEIFDNTTQTTLRLADSSTELFYARFSPNCRFIAVSTYDSRAGTSWNRGYRLVVYDATTAQVVTEFTHIYRGWHLRWSPDEQYLLWIDHSDLSLLNIQTDELLSVKLWEDEQKYIVYVGPVYWDLERGQLITMLSWAIHAIDLRTGELRYRYLPPIEYEDCKRSVRENSCNWRVEDDKLYFSGDDAVVVWDLNTSEIIETRPKP
jgi:hypothetical protein